jgi:hypothetical protein
VVIKFAVVIWNSFYLLNGNQRAYLCGISEDSRHSFSSNHYLTAHWSRWRDFRLNILLPPLSANALALYEIKLNAIDN